MAKVHFSVSLSREAFAWVESEAAKQPRSRSQVIDTVIKDYRRDVFLLEKIKELIREQWADIHSESETINVRRIA